MVDMNGSVMSVLWSIAVVAMIPLVLWLLKRSPLGASLGTAPGASAPVRAVASLAIGTQQRIVTVEVGEGEARRWLVLGVTAQQITPLHTLDAPSQAGQGTAAQAASFNSLLAGWRGEEAGRDVR
jgi:flagellar protein FliO/FliZ